CPEPHPPVAIAERAAEEWDGGRAPEHRQALRRLQPDLPLRIGQEDVKRLEEAGITDGGRRPDRREALVRTRVPDPLQQVRDGLRVPQQTKKLDGGPASLSIVGGLRI